MSTKQCVNCTHTVPLTAQFCPYCGQTFQPNQTGQLPPQYLLDNRYLIVKLVGQGGMGAVYQAVDTRIQGRLCAVKEMSTYSLPINERSQAVQNFEQEAQLLAHLQHACLPKVHDYFKDDASGRYYLVMDFVEGHTLESILNQYGPLPESDVRQWANQICSVLTYLHQQSPPIIFRDLKPGNIMLDKNGQIKLIDFGIARFFKPTQTKDTQVIGTPGFAAPEQYGQGQTDTRSDIYGLGVTLLVLLTGFDPSQSPFALPEARQVNNKLSPEISAIVQRAIQHDPNQRWQSTTELQQALTSGNLIVEQKKRPLWIIGVVFLLILGLGASTWALSNNDTPATPSPTEVLEREVATRLVVVTSVSTPTPNADMSSSLSTLDAGDNAPVIESANATNTPPHTATIELTGTPVPTFTYPPTPIPAPVVSNTQGRIVFQSNRDGDYEIYSINIYGSDLRKLTDNNIDDKYPAVSPNGRYIAYQVWTGSGERWEIYTMNIDGSNQTRITNTGGWNRLPTWSSDSQQIAFISDRSGELTVYIMDADGQNVRPIAVTGERDGHVSWSVNNVLAFNTGGSSSRAWRIVTTDTNGRNLQALTGNGNWSPEWSPDGRSIVFISSRFGGDANPGIFLMDADGSNQRQLYDSSNYEWGARWSGDGQSILFTVDENNIGAIYMISANGGHPILITTRGSYPDWVNNP